MKNFRIPLLPALFTLIFPVMASAQTSGDQHPMLTEAFSLQVGGFLPSKRVDFRVGGVSPGEDIDFDNNVAIANTDTTGSGVFRWRFGDKWSVWGQYWKSNESNTATLQEDVIWDDTTFEVGTNVGAGFDLSVARLFFGRIFSSGQQHEFGMGLGLHWLKFGAFIEGEAIINGESAGFRRESVDANAPLPNIGAWYWYAITPRWLVTTRLDWLGATIGEYSGSLWNANAGINFQAWQNVGFGLSYQYFRINLDVDKPDWNGGADLTYRGPFISLNVNW